MPTAQDYTGGHLQLTFGPGLWDDNNSLGWNGNIIAPANGIWLRSFTAVNEGSSKTWIMIFDSATLPTNGSSPLFVGIPIEVGSYASWDFAPPREFFQGIYWVASSTTGTLTQDSSATINVSMGH